MSEHDEQKALIKWRDFTCNTDSRLDMLFAIPNGGVYSSDSSPKAKAIAARRGKKMKMEGVTPGVFDLFLSVPATEFNGLYIEMKFGRNKLTPNQKVFKLNAECFGYKCVVCYSSVEAIESIKEYLGS